MFHYKGICWKTGCTLSYYSSCLVLNGTYVFYWNPDLLPSISFSTIQKLVIHNLLHNRYINEFLHILLLCIILKAINLFFLIISYGKDIVIFSLNFIVPAKFRTFQTNFFSYLLDLILLFFLFLVGNRIQLKTQCIFFWIREDKFSFGVLASSLIQVDENCAYESQALIMCLIIEASCYKYTTHWDHSCLFRLQTWLVHIH